MTVAERGRRKGQHGLDVAEDPVEFGRQVLRVELWSHQLDAVRSARFMIAVAGGWRSGKTLAAQVRALWVARCRRGRRRRRAAGESTMRGTATAPVAAAAAPVAGATRVYLCHDC